jgi:hypothetical protein
MKRFWSGVLILGLGALVPSAALNAQTAKTATSRKKATTTAEELRAMREMMEQQQQQIQGLQQQLQQRDAAFQQLQQQVQRTQADLSAAQQSAQAAETNSSSSQDALTQLRSDMADVKTTLTNGAVQTQEEQKRVSGIEGTLARFRWSGDVRVRYENFVFDYTGCVAPNCESRHRARIRARLGVEGKLSEDFTGGIYLATGLNEGGVADLTDPVSTNNTLTSFFERKTIGLDRAWITYQPLNHKWLALTGGKFAYTWNRTPLTFDNDLNPEGFSEKFNFDFGHKVFKNVNVTTFQLFFRENNSGAAPRVDSYTTGGAVAAKLQLGSRWTMTPSYSLMRWDNADPIAAARTAGTLGGNALTNCTNAAKTAFCGGFFYSDLIIDNTITTPWKRFPWRVMGEYVQNLAAEPTHLDIATYGAGPCDGGVCFNEQDKAFWVETSLGQTKSKNDLQAGYSFARVGQDAVIALFNESDMRATTNVLQHRVFFSWLPMNNTTLSWTWWLGRTLNTNLANAARPSGLAVGAEDPILRRMQLDVIYKF